MIELASFSRKAAVFTFTGIAADRLCEELGIQTLGICTVIVSFSPEGLDNEDDYKQNQLPLIPADASRPSFWLCPSCGRSQQRTQGGT